MRIAILGMGNMGKAMALRLLNGDFEVTVWNRTPGKAEDVVKSGATEVEDLTKAVSGADVVISSLANDDAVRTVVFGDGMLQDSIGDAIYLDASTISPELSSELADRFARFAAMPIAGSPVAVRQGEATYLVGGPEEVREAAQPLLQALCSTQHEYESAPLAVVAKLTTNLLLLIGVVALAESFETGRRGGLTDDQLRELLAESPMVAAGIRNRFDAVLTGEGPSWWTVELGLKDAGLALGVADGDDLPALTAVRRRFEEPARQGLDDQDIASVARLYEQS
jgi:3-hydroxyisobutyrate dehydrogenase-like beta-hydroxyacid dehydrogenase